jgi:hypothetical protein
MTIYDIKAAVAQTEPYFFNSRTMKSFGQTLKSFSVRKDGTRYFISAPSRMNGRIVGYTQRYFNPETNKLEFE